MSNHESTNAACRILKNLLRKERDGKIGTIDLSTFKKEFVGGGCDDPAGCSPLDFVKSYLQPALRNREDCVSVVIGEPTPLPDLSYMHTFPSRIHEVYLYVVRKYEDDSFVLLAQLKSGVFILYRATCCYTGFNVCGDMRVIASRSLARLIEFGMTDAERFSLHALQE